MRNTRALISALLTTTLALCLSGPAITHAQEPTVVESHSIPLERGNSVNVDIGHINVPENRAQLDSREISVGFYRFRSSKAGASAPIVLLPGGPGSSQIQRLEHSSKRGSGVVDLIKLYRQVGDVVLVDLRGVNSSKPNPECAGSGQRWNRIDSEEEYLQLKALGARACREKLIADGFDVAGYNVIEAAADVVAVMKALGYESFNVYGSSFGSHWALTLIKYYSAHVQRAIVSGVEGYDHTYDHPLGTREVLQRISVASEPAWHASGREGSPLAMLDRLMAHSLQGAKEAHGLQPHEVVRMGLGGPGFSLSNRSGITGWPAAMAQLADGNFGGQLRKFRWWGARRIGPNGTGGAVHGMFDCASGLSAARRSAMRAANDPLLERRAFSHYDAICLAWNVPLLPDSFRTSAHSEVPVLFVQGDIDFSTPPINALETAANFPNGQLVVVKNGSHNAYSEAFALDDRMAKMSLDWLRGAKSIVSSLELAPLRFDAFR